MSIESKQPNRFSKKAGVSIPHVRPNKGNSLDQKDYIQQIVVRYEKKRCWFEDYEYENFDEIENAEIYWTTQEECLRITREDESIEISQSFGHGITTVHKYCSPDRVNRLLDDLDVNILFGEPPIVPEDLLPDQEQQLHYSIWVAFERRKPITIEGFYDRYGLPQYFADFMDRLKSILPVQTFFDLLDREQYRGARRRASDYMYCSVRFSQSDCTYYYISEDRTIQVGDLVVVPAGRANKPTLVQVEKVDYFCKENAPIPPEQTKRILYKKEEITQEEKNLFSLF